MLTASIVGVTSTFKHSQFLLESSKLAEMNAAVGQWVSTYSVETWLWHCLQVMKIDQPDSFHSLCCIKRLKKQLILLPLFLCIYNICLKGYYYIMLLHYHFVHVHVRVTVLLRRVQTTGQGTYRVYNVLDKGKNLASAVNISDCVCG